MTNKLPNINWKHFFMNTLCIEPFCPQKTHNRLLLFDSTLKNGHHFDYWNQPLNMRICCLAGLCYYLVIHIENLRVLHPLQLFYFYLWSIYWLSLILTINM
jgi:hypothetical protein